MRVLVSAPPILKSLRNYSDVFKKQGIEVLVPDFDFKESLSEQDLHKLLKDVDGILCGDDKLTRSVLEKATKLRVISKWGTGVDSIDLVAAENLGIKVYRVKNVFADPVADTVLAYILFFSRRLFEKDRVVRSGNWHKVHSHSLKERSLGIIGVGNIGGAVARRAAAFGMTIYGCDIKTIFESLLRETGAKQISFEETISRADFISLNCDLNKSSHHLINHHSLKLMKTNAILINTARGSLIDELALIDALAMGKIAGAALDVFEIEPLPMDNPLRKFENVLMSPHNSNGSPSVFATVHQASIQNLLFGLGFSDHEYAFHSDH